MNPNVLVPIANGTEELEAITIIDILRRAECNLTVASCAEQPTVTAAHGVQIGADKLISECSNTQWDMIVLPGGIPGAEHLRDNGTLTDLVKNQRQENRWLAAICAAPAVVLAHHGLVDDIVTTCYPAFRAQLPKPEPDTSITVVTDTDNRVITSQGPGTAFAFALELVRQLWGSDKAALLASQMVAHWPES